MLRVGIDRIPEQKSCMTGRAMIRRNVIGSRRTWIHSLCSTERNRPKENPFIAPPRENAATCRQEAPCPGLCGCLAEHSSNLKSSAGWPQLSHECRDELNK